MSASAVTLFAFTMVGAGGPAQATTAIQATSAIQTEPGSPGAPGTATEVWVESFEDGLDDGQLKKLTDYEAADDTTYKADRYWANGQCNGFVLDGQTTDATMEQNGCTGAGEMPTWASELGGSQHSPDPTNHALANFTSDPAPSAQDVVARSTPIQGANGHYLLVGLDHYGASCEAAQPQLSLALGYQSADHKVGDVDVCQDPAQPVLTTWLPYRLPGDVSRFQYVLKNSQAEWRGNDFAVDNLTVLDETPQLDQAFSRSEATVGETVTLTYTVTNVEGPLGLGAKTDFGFRNLLPEGLIVDPDGMRTMSTTCGDGTVTQSPKGTVNFENGDLKAGETSCTVNVPVTAHEAGSYNNGAASVQETGLLEPNSATVRFVSDGDDDDNDGDDDGDDDDDFVAPDTGSTDGGDSTAPYALAGVGALLLAGAVGGLLMRRRHSTS